MPEYWLLKKTIGGWSHVTSYQDEAQAKRNYQSCLQNGMSGYSWRLVQCNVIKEDMINDVVEVGYDDSFAKDNAIINAPIKTGWGQPVQDAPKSVSVPGARPWGQNSIQQAPSQPAGLSSHGLAGSVWVIHHQLRQKSRIPSSELDSYLNKGYIRGGPRTQFEG